MPDTTKIEAVDVLKRIQKRISVALKSGFIDISFSAGVATFPIDSQTKDKLIKKADKALYWAKYHGKNQIITTEKLLSKESDDKKSNNRVYLNTIKALAAAVDAKDSYTRYHSQRLMLMVKEICKKNEL